jgi:hypothetical protein
MHESHLFFDRERFPRGIKDVAAQCADVVRKETAHARFHADKFDLEHDHAWGEDFADHSRDGWDREDHLERDHFTRESGGLSW